MPYQVFTSPAVKRRRDGSFKITGGHVGQGQSYDLNEAREQILDTSNYIKYTGDELKNFQPGRVPVDNFAKVRIANTFTNAKLQSTHMRR